MNQKVDDVISEYNDLASQYNRHISVFKQELEKIDSFLGEDYLLDEEDIQIRSDNTEETIGNESVPLDVLTSFRTSVTDISSSAATYVPNEPYHFTATLDASSFIQAMRKASESIEAYIQHKEITDVTRDYAEVNHLPYADSEMEKNDTAILDGYWQTAIKALQEAEAKIFLINNQIAR